MLDQPDHQVRLCVTLDHPELTSIQEAVVESIYKLSRKIGANLHKEEHVFLAVIGDTLSNGEKKYALPHSITKLNDAITGSYWPDVHFVLDGFKINAEDFAKVVEDTKRAIVKCFEIYNPISIEELDYIQQGLPKQISFHPIRLIVKLFTGRS